MAAARNEYVVFALGSDRPGIVAGVTDALYRAGANLLDCSMTILSGQFAVVLVVESDLDTAGVEAALGGPGEDLGLAVLVRPVGQGAAAPGRARSVVSVYGSDQPGIVARVTRALAERSVNVTDLETRRVGDPGAPVYAMLLEVELPDGLSQAALAEALGALAGELDVDVSVHDADADVL